MLPEEKLARSALIFRNQSQTQKAKRYKQPTDTNATIIGYDASTGQNIIQLPDGSISYACSDTNGTLALGETVPLHSGTMRVDGLPNIKRQPKEVKKVIPKTTPYSFWMLAGQYILQWDVVKDVATLSVITESSVFPSPSNDFHAAEFGLSRINKNEFYLPQFGSLSKYNISDKSAFDVVGEIYSNGGIQNPHACYTLPTGESLFSVEMDDENETARIYYFKKDGSFEFTEVINNYQLEIWSIAAIDANLMYVTIFYGSLALFNRLTGELTYIFSSIRADVPSMYGDTIDGLRINEITYAFMDVSSNDCYVVGIVKDSGVPGLQTGYVLNSVENLGDVPGEPGLKIVRADFPPGIVTPGDQINNYGYVHRVINDTTVHCVTGNNSSGVQRSFLSTSQRENRTVIWKVTPDLNVSIYYKFPTIDNRESADGYRLFFNNYCRGGLIDPKTKDIYLYGRRLNVIKDGVYYFNDGGFDNGNLIKITSGKKLVVLKNKFATTVSSEDKESITNRWYTDPTQLETIY